MTEKLVRVLVADDSEDDRILLACNLRSVPGFELTGTTVNGVETIAWLDGNPPYCNREKYPYPELLLLDYQMPGYSGLDVMQWIHDQPQQPRVVLWSHSVNLIDQPKAYKLGAAMICGKPGGRSDLSAILGRALPRALSVPEPAHTLTMQAHKCS
jgi:CheY-like chemotaxis protein